MPGPIKHDDIEEIFTYHPPTPEQQIAYGAIKEASARLALVIIDVVPECADRTHALRVVRDARMWANAAIALRGKV